MTQPSNYEEVLSRGYVRDRDFRISFGDSRIERGMLVAPHGGGIEPGSSEIMRAVADRGGWAFYEFAGFLMQGNKSALHIASTRFDEPTLLSLLPRAAFVLAFHGASEDRDALVYVGGRWSQGRQIVMDSINASMNQHGIAAVDATASPAADNLRGMDPANITNRGRRAEGIQLEFTRGARNLLFPPDASREVRGRRSLTLRPLALSIHAALKQLSSNALATAS